MIEPEIEDTIAATPELPKKEFQEMFKSSSEAKSCMCCCSSAAMSGINMLWLMLMLLTAPTAAGYGLRMRDANANTSVRANNLGDVQQHALQHQQADVH